jgi:membrane protease YdiL (CAAX protease family)
MPSPRDHGIPPPDEVAGSRDRETVDAGRLRTEVLIVLGLSVGQSAVYALVSLVAKLTQGPLAQQTATMNAPRSPRPYLDLAYQLLGIGFGLVPVALALWLLSATQGSIRAAARGLGLDGRRPVADLALGAGLAAVIGIPGIGLYLGGRALGVTATIVPSALDAYWWTMGVLVLAAVRNSLLEEVVAVGYLVDRLERLGWAVPAIVVASSALRGAYHLYQGFGPFVGNAVMGVVFTLVYLRTRRLMPLVVAHTLLDAVAFVGYDLFGDALSLP